MFWFLIPVITVPVLAAVVLETATHVAGPSAGIGKRTIQRCCICGEKLMDSADKDMLTMWEEGALVRAKEGKLNATGRNLLTSNMKLPKDFCLALVERS